MRLSPLAALRRDREHCCFYFDLCCNKCFVGTADDVVAAAAVFLLAALGAAAAAATALAPAELPTNLEQAFCLSTQVAPLFISHSHLRVLAQRLMPSWSAEHPLPWAPICSSLGT